MCIFRGLTKPFLRIHYINDDLESCFISANNRLLGKEVAKIPLARPGDRLYFTLQVWAVIHPAGSLKPKLFHHHGSWLIEGDAVKDHTSRQTFCKFNRSALMILSIVPSRNPNKPVNGQALFNWPLYKSEMDRTKQPDQSDHYILDMNMRPGSRLREKECRFWLHLMGAQQREVTNGASKLLLTRLFHSRKIPLVVHCANCDKSFRQ